MKEYDINKVKNIAFAGHNGSGKTSLAEAVLYKAGASDRLGKTIFLIHPVFSTSQQK